MNFGRISKAALSVFALLSISAHAKDFPAVPGEYVVKLKSSVRLLSARELEKNLNASIVRNVSPSLGLILVKRPAIETGASAIRTLAQNPGVEYAEPNYIFKVNAGSSALPTDPQLGQLWGMVNTGQAVSGDSGKFQAVNGIDIDAARAWQIETGSNEVIVAVIDTGVNYNEPDLAGNIFTNQAELNGKAGVDDDNNGFVDDIHGYDFTKKTGDPMDVFGHGTHVSGTIGARANDGIGVAGIAWNVTILPVRFLGDDGSGNLADAVSAIDYAITMKANIMNNSWGGGQFTQALYDEINKAKQAGILFVAAAGNDTNDNDGLNPGYPASYQLDNIISVAAVDPTGKLADFSNFGRTSVHIAAPGVDIFSHTMKGLESWSGTSMATPHVVGVAALLLSQDKTQNYMTIKNRIMAAARPLAALRNRTISSGMVDAYLALTNQVAPADANDPFNWQKNAQSASTPHPYANKDTNTWTFNVPGAKEVSVYFSKFSTEINYDKVEFKDGAGKVVGTLSGKLDDTFGPVVTGDTVTITFTADDSNTDYGFDVGGVSYR